MAGRPVIMILMALLTGCATALTPAEQANLNWERREHEQDRQEKFKMWKIICARSGGMEYRYNTSRPCRGRHDCVPPRFDWDFYYLKPNPERSPRKLDWKPKGSNTVSCVDPREFFW